MARAVTEYGRLDHLINNAVRFVFGHLRGAGNGSGTGSDRDISDEDWDMLFKTNVLGYARCIKHALPHMRKNKPSAHVFSNDQGRGAPPSLPFPPPHSTPQCANVPRRRCRVQVCRGWTQAPAARS